MMTALAWVIFAVVLAAATRAVRAARLVPARWWREARTGEAR